MRQKYKIMGVVTWEVEGRGRYYVKWAALLIGVALEEILKKILLKVNGWK